MLVKPAPGCAIRAPGTMQLVPDEGLEIDPLVLFWARALLDGDLVEVTPESAPGSEVDSDRDDASAEGGAEAPVSEAPEQTPAKAGPPAHEAAPPEHSDDAAPSDHEGS